jgi:hypothetical protein
MKGRYGIEGGSVEKSQSARLASLDHPQWAEAMVYMLRKAHGLRWQGALEDKGGWLPSLA